MALVVGAAAFLTVWNPFERVDHVAWEGDFDKLLADLARGYANFELRDVRAPRDLEERTRRTIREAGTNRVAREAILQYVDAWHDPHLRVDGRRSMPAFLRGKRFLRLDLPRERTLALANGRRAGVLRISSFEGESLEAMRSRLRQLEAALERIKRHDVDVLLIDITGNGGGTDWAEAAARMVAAKPLQCNEVGYVRHRHHVSRMEDDLARIKEDLARADVPPGQRALLEQAAAKLRSLIGGGEFLIRGSGCGLLNYAAPGTLAGLKSAEVLYEPERLRWAEGVWTGRLAVLIDGGTASAAEWFASILRDNDAATLLGQRTMGAGCGYTDGGIQSNLPHSGMRVRMPDCARFRANGENEVIGIEPDVPVSSLTELAHALGHLR